MTRLVHSLRELEALRPQWDELYRRRGETNLFVTHAWVENWIRCFAPTRFAAAISDDAALAVRRDGSSWHSLGDHSYRPDVLSTRGRGESLPPLLEALGRRGRGPVVLDNAPRALIDALSHRRVVTVPKYGGSLRAINTAVSFDDYLAARPKKVRSELRRKRRKLEREVPGIELKVWREPAEMDEAFAAVLAIESDSWKGESDTSIASSGAERRFYRGVLDLRDAETEPRVYALVGAEPITYILGVAHREVFYALKCSYRAQHARHSPGGNVFTYAIEEACGDPRFERIELLGNDARWKRELADIEDETCWLELRRRTLAALAYAVGYEKVRPRLKEAIAAARSRAQALRERATDS